MSNNFRINTGYIFQDLKKSFNNYDREFLIEVVEMAYQAIAYLNHIISTDFDGENGKYLENYYQIRYPRDLDFARKHENFPFPDYFLRGKRDCDYLVIVEYGIPFDLQKTNEYYDLFFALNFSLTDVMDAESFLQFHLEKTFDNDIEIFKKFIQNICIKYNDFLERKYAPIVTSFFKTHPIDKDLVKEISDESTTRRQVLAIHYLMNELDVYKDTDKTEIAKFIQFLNGKETRNPKINNTNIYKYLKNPLSTGDKGIESDLQFIRLYFVKLGLFSIVDKIDKEIKSRK